MWKSWGRKKIVQEGRCQCIYDPQIAPYSQIQSSSLVNDFQGVVDRIMSPTHKDVHVLIPETYEYVTLHDKRDFTDKNLKMGGLAWIIHVGPMSSQGYLGRQVFGVSWEMEKQRERERGRGGRGR